MQNPMRGGNRREEDAQKLAESHSHGSDGARLDHQEQGPAVKKAPQRPQRFAQEHILAAGAGHHGGEFAIAERRGDGHKSGDDPGANEERGGIDFAGNFSGDNEDARADHRTHYQHGGAG